LTAQNHDTVAVQFNPQRFAEEIVTDLLIAASFIVSSAMGLQPILPSQFPDGRRQNQKIPVRSQPKPWAFSQFVPLWSVDYHLALSS